MKKFFKKFAVIFLAFIMAFAFASCGSPGENDQNNQKQDSGAEGENSSDNSGETPGDGTVDGAEDGADDGSGGCSDNGSEDGEGDTAGEGSGDASIAITATEVLNALLQRPEPWSFFPDALTFEKMSYTTAPVSDFSSFVNVSAIAEKHIGQEMSVLYSGLSTAESVLSTANAVYTAGQALGTLYQNFLNGSPENYKLFTGNTSLAGVNFSFRIELDESNYSLLAKGGAVCAELYTNGVQDIGRIQITDGAVLKYVSTENTLRLAIEFTATILGYTGLFTQDITFARDTETGVITGYMFEYLGTDSGTGTELANAFFYSDSTYTAIISNAKDSGSLLTVNSYLELYSSQTGEFIGARVLESVPVTGASYDTYWFNLYDVTGFNSVRVTDEENSDNGLNANSVYVNGSSTAFSVEWNKIALVKTSRKYDIELKAVDYVIAETNSEGEKSYTTYGYKIPMLFVQADELTSFSSDCVKNNSDSFSSTPTLPSYTAINSYFDLLQPYYEALGEQVDYTSTIAFIGEANSYFNDN